MKQPDEFDAFYKSARTRLLLQTYALTGDLPASRSAVRDSFVVTWHHWRKVSRLPDPESWVRPHAWAQAQRRHTTRIWHRDKQPRPGGGPHAGVARQALGRAAQGAAARDRLTTLPLGRARPRARPDPAEAERQTRAAAEGFAALRDVEPAALPGCSRRLHAQVEDVHLAARLDPAAVRRRPPSYAHPRRRGRRASRPWSCTGFVVDGSNGPSPAPAGGPRRRPIASNAEPEEPAQFDADALVGEDELGLAVDGTGWRATRTSDNREGNGLATPCQQRRYADPTGPRRPGALLHHHARAGASRRWRPCRRPSCPTASRLPARTWDQSLAWYAGCTAPQVQLGTTMRVADVGDEAMLVQLRDWSKGRTYLAGVARTGRITTTTFYRTDDNAEPDVAGATRMLVLAVNGMCPTPQGDGCATTPRTEEVAPVPVGRGPRPARERRPADGPRRWTDRGSARRRARRATTSLPPPATAPTSRPTRSATTSPGPS